MLPVAAFWPYTNNQGKWWGVALVSGVMLIAGCLALRREPASERRSVEVAHPALLGSRF